MSRYDRPTFRPEDKFVARRSFTYNGRKYTAGQPFPWEHIACSSRKLRDLFTGNFITAQVEEKPVEKKTRKKVDKKAEASSSAAEIKEFLNDQSD